MKKYLIIALLLISATTFGQLTLINVGTSANDKTGDPLRTAFQKTNLAITQVNTNTTNIALKAPLLNPVFLGLLKISTTDTVATRAYARAVGGGGGGGGGAWGAITGTVDSLLAVVVDLKNQVQTILNALSYLDLTPPVFLSAELGTFADDTLLVMMDTTDIQQDSIPAISAVVGGNVIDDGGGIISDRGICWSTSANPTIIDSHVHNGTGLGSFEVTMTGLKGNTTYHARAFATNEEGTSYSADVGMTTPRFSVISLGHRIKQGHFIMISR